MRLGQIMLLGRVNLLAVGGVFNRVTGVFDTVFNGIAGVFDGISGVIASVFFSRAAGEESDGTKSEKQCE